MLKSLSKFSFVIILAISFLSLNSVKVYAYTIDLNTVKPPSVGGIYWSSGGQMVTGNLNAGQTLNVRRGPGTNYEVIGSLGIDEVVTIRGLNKNTNPYTGNSTWYYVEYNVTGTTNKKLGWVSRQFLFNFE